MEAEDRKKLDRVLSLTEENNQILKKLRRQMRWSRAIRIAYWIIIIAASIGAFYYFQPFIDSLKSVYGSVQGTADQFNSLFGN